MRLHLLSGNDRCDLAWSRCIWLVLFVAITVPAFGDESQLVTPQLTRPTTEAPAGDALHEKYEAAWFRYEQAIGEVRDKVNAALDAQFEKAADAGNLDLADMWDKKKKFFADTGAVSWPSDGKAKVEWRKKHPTTDFPDNFSEVISAAGAGFEKAVATLKDDYESLVKDYTKERNLAQAKALRDELAGLARKPAVAQERPKMVEMKPSRVTQMRLKHAPDAVSLDGHFYKVFWGRCSWHEAKGRCEMAGGYLSCLETQDEQKKVAALKGNGKVVWVGGFRNEKGRFVWINGQPLDINRLRIDDPKFTFVGFAVGENLNVRPASGSVEGFIVRDIQGFVCEWDE